MARRQDRRLQRPRCGGIARRAPVRRATPDLPGLSVEGDRADLQVAGRRRAVVVDARDQPQDVAVADADALRPAGRARGVDDVGQGLRRLRRRRHRALEAHGLLDRQAAQAVVRQVGQQGLRRSARPARRHRPAASGDAPPAGPAPAAGRRRRRAGRRAGRRQQQAARQVQADDLARAHAGIRQRAGDALGRTALQLGVALPGRRRIRRRRPAAGARPARRSGRSGSGAAPAGRPSGSAASERPSAPGALPGRAAAGSRPGRRRSAAAAASVTKWPSRRSIRAASKRSLQYSASRPSAPSSRGSAREEQVDPAAPGLQRHRREAWRRPAPGARRARSAGRRAPGRAADSAGRAPAAGPRPGARRARPGGRRRRARSGGPGRAASGSPAAREVAAQRQGVDEKADQALALRAVAPGDRRADDQVALAGEAVEQSPEEGQERHEQGGAAASGELPQGACLGRRDQGHRAPPLGRDRRAGPVGGQLEQLRGAGRRSRQWSRSRSSPRPRTAVARRRSRDTGPAAPAAATAGLR